MWKLLGAFSAFLSLSGFAQAATTKMAVKVVAISAKLDNSTWNNSSKCEGPSQSGVGPDKCCAFPDLFPDAIVDSCEKEFSMNGPSSSNDFLADSVSWKISQSYADHNMANRSSSA